MTSIWAEEAGPPDAPLIVLIHGSMDRSTGMLRLSRRLDDAFRVLRYDRRGYGRSVGDHDRYDMGAQVDDLIALLAGRRAVLVGHSYGGNVAMATATRRPDLVAAVALYETPLSWEPWWPGTTAGAQATATSGDAGDAAERFMRRLVGDDVWEGLPARTRATRRAEGPAMVGELKDLQANRPWVSAEIGCPVVLSCGSNGAAHHQQGTRFIHDQFPDSTFVVLDGCRHDAPMSHSQLFASVVVGAAAVAAGEPWASAFSRSAAHRS
jgi:pimeloyl-ACP methyl ester carboxylesterase